MDNKAYLDTIAVKGKTNTKFQITPGLIKLILAGLIALITLIVVGAVISGSNAKVIQSYERVYLRISNLAGDESPLRLHLDDVRDSDVRAAASAFLTTLTTTNMTLEGLTSSIGVNTGKISKEVSSEESMNISSLTATLEESQLTGTIDSTYSSELNYQVTTLIALEQEAQKKNTNQEFANLLTKSLDDLTKIQSQIKKYSSVGNN